MTTMSRSSLVGLATSAVALLALAPPCVALTFDVGTFSGTGATFTTSGSVTTLTVTGSTTFAPVVLTVNGDVETLETDCNLDAPGLQIFINGNLKVSGSLAGTFDELEINGSLEGPMDIDDAQINSIRIGADQKEPITIRNSTIGELHIHGNAQEEIGLRGAQAGSCSGLAGCSFVASLSIGGNQNEPVTLEPSCDQIGCFAIEGNPFSGSCPLPFDCRSPDVGKIGVEVDSNTPPNAQLTATCQPTPVTLDGGATSDAQDQLSDLEFEFTFLQRPGGSSATLVSGADPWLASFTPDIGGSYVVQMCARDTGCARECAMATCTVCPSLGVVDFRGTNPCVSGDGDRVVLGGQANSFILLNNPGAVPIELIQFDFSDPQFSSPIVPPATVPAGGGLAVPLTFTPAGEGGVIGTVEFLTVDGTFGCLDLIGEGLPDKRPALGLCDIAPNVVLLGQSTVLTLEASDSAGLSNIAICRATGSRGAGGLPPRFVLFSLVDDGSAINDIPCDGVFTHTQPTGGLFGRGTWDFTYECQDKQGNVTTTGPLCTLVVQR